MKSLLKYGAPVTKIHAMRAGMMTYEKYKKLALCTSVYDAVDYLEKNTAYSHSVKGFGTDVHRAALEKALKGAVFADYLKLRRYLDKRDREFVSASLKRYETDFLKTAVRNCMIEKPSKSVSDFGYSKAFEELADFSVRSVVEADSMPGLIKSLEGTPYSDVLKTLYSRGKSPSLFETETNLDIYYFKNLQSIIKRYFEGDMEKRLERAVGIEADILNLFWIYRCKKYYRLQNEIVYAMIIPVHGFLTNERIRTMVETDDFEAELRRINPLKIPIENYTNEAAGRMHLKAAVQILEKLRKEDPYSVIAVISYLLAKELETENVCSVIEGIRYNLKSEEIMKYVIL